MCRLLWLVPLVLLQACAGNPLAEQLERSFGAVETDSVSADQSTAPSTSGTPQTPAAKAAKGTITTGSPAEDSPEKDSPEKDSPAKDSPSKDMSAEGKPKAQPATAVADGAVPNSEAAGTKPVVKVPQPLEPYRITIRLAGADPAAPAEAVTRALRQSEVTFSVERIERVTP
ncbi:MAG: hypothetical protein ISQ52_01945 [Synechococcus sp. BS307-5m-G38]|nr:hypothetical protein [Synechococcus sp. BS307-5m-G38]